MDSASTITCFHAFPPYNLGGIWPRGPPAPPSMPPATYVARAVNRAFPVLHGQAFLALKRPDFGSEWFPATSRLRLGCALRPLPVQQKRFNSYNSETWYTSCARLGVDPNGSVKDFKKAYYKLAKVEHPDQDKTPGAKERFHKVSKTLLSPTTPPLFLAHHLSSCKRLSSICVKSRTGRSMIERSSPGKRRPLLLRPIGQLPNHQP